MKQQLEALGNRVTEGGRSAQEGAERAKEVLENVGTKTQDGVDAAKGALTRVGDAVLELSGNEDKPRPEGQ